jgi:transposase
MDMQVYEVILNLPQLRMESAEIDDKTIRFYCSTKSGHSVCPSCGAESTVVNQYTQRQVRDLDISGRKVYLMLRLKQYECSCGRYHTETLDFVEGNKEYTKRQAKWIFELSVKQPFTAAAALVDVPAKTVERIFYDHVQLDSVERYEGIEDLGIDEISFSKGKNDYLCVLTNLATGQTVDILRTREKSALMSHLQSIKFKNGQALTDRIAKVSCDFWGPFMDVAKKLFPQAVLVADRFHWTIYLNKVLDTTRKQLRKENPDEDAFKSIKWLLFKQSQNISESQQEQLRTAFRLSPMLEELYEMVKTFVAIFEARFDFDFAIKQINLWLEQAKVLNNKALNDFTDFLQRHFEPITNFIKHPVSNAATEGNNNLIRTVKRFTFNMTNFDHFKARCLAMKL